MKKILVIALCGLMMMGCIEKPSERIQIGTTLQDTINGVPCVVYLPTGWEKYQKKRSKRRAKYPVLYLQHGMVGNEFDWTVKGNLVGIMDSLLQEKKVVEMVVIMPDNCPERSTYTEEFTNATSGEWEAHFAEFMAESERKYPISNDPSKRAIAGLSMGGYHTMKISALLDGQFRYVGMFSAATMGATMPSEPTLLWLAIGKDDFLYLPFKGYLHWLDKQGRPYTYYETEGGHEWPNWQDYITKFLPLCFQEE